MSTSSSLATSPALQRTVHPTNTNYLESQSYILALADLPAHYAASASSPSDAIHLFDKSTLQSTATLPGHSGGITALRAASLNGHKNLVSAGKDGTVKTWDARSGAAAVKMTMAGRPRALLSCDASSDGLTVAAGTELQSADAFILYWDPRNPSAPLRTHGSTHSDDVTVLHFHPEKLSTILSGSSDGLLCTSNAQEDDEDEAVVDVANWGCSVSQAGWTSSGVWAASDMETFGAWNEELDAIYGVDIRTYSTDVWTTDYLIGCHASGSAPLKIFAGSNAGGIGLLTNTPDSPWTLQNIWTGGHTGVVRSVLWDERNGVLVTGGEDAKLNTWAWTPAADAMDVDEAPVGRKRGSHEDSEQIGKRRRT
ncbi:hypothetical protein PLICRDRAFT_170630 [Plicaturopsis crispa FD-325 SS-3]|nr:hypothetical protein PLICRDRAFT_170630 [Plicaturopsis crispa FD-325 SS-3]